MAATTAHAVGGAGTLVLSQPPQQQQGAPSTSTTAHPTISDAVTLRLVPRRKKKKSVKWAEDVAEINENSGKRKSKKCCIFHRQRQFGDWSDDDDSDCDCDDEQQGDSPQQGPPAPSPGPQLAV